MSGEKIAEGIYLIGGPNITHSEDAAVFLVEFGADLIMIDSGAGRSFRKLVRNIEEANLDPARISSIFLTHCHIDHIGAAPLFKKRFGCDLIIHEADAGPLETGDPVKTAANWYETEFPPTAVDRKLSKPGEEFKFGHQSMYCLHTPGHTPGSISIYLDRGGERILFGQDVHGPFLSSFDSDLRQWRESMQKLLDLNADVLCEGHFGIFRGKDRVRGYIQSQLRSNPS